MANEGRRISRLFGGLFGPVDVTNDGKGTPLLTADALPPFAGAGDSASDSADDGSRIGSAGSSDGKRLHNHPDDFEAAGTSHIFLQLPFQDICLQIPNPAHISDSDAERPPLFSVKPKQSVLHLVDTSKKRGRSGKCFGSRSEKLITSTLTFRGDYSGELDSSRCFTLVTKQVTLQLYYQSTPIRERRIAHLAGMGHPPDSDNMQDLDDEHGPTLISATINAGVKLPNGGTTEAPMTYLFRAHPDGHALWLGTPSPKRPTYSTHRSHTVVDNAGMAMVRAADAPAFPHHATMGAGGLAAGNVFSVTGGAAGSGTRPHPSPPGGEPDYLDRFGL